ncbi:relaxase domain-containing protein [Streptomyces sp. NPDC091387]|uniref:relaxase domain-containing protein n=1 Tax=Streptomyces sp. NPDC091387 TaxID=3365998 RepID=UPI00381BEE68
MGKQRSPAAVGRGLPGGRRPASGCVWPRGARRRASRHRCSLSTFTFRPQASLIVWWALEDDGTRRVIERAHEPASARALRWLEDEVAESWWSSGARRRRPSWSRRLGTSTTGTGPRSCATTAWS